jgi:hypothetical protein
MTRVFTNACFELSSYPTADKAYQAAYFGQASKDCMNNYKQPIITSSQPTRGCFRAAVTDCQIASNNA